jgi:hypothetical protein
LIENSPLAVNSAVIASIKPGSELSIKFLAFDSVLSHDRILDVLKKIEKIHPALILFNRYREHYYFYSSRKAIDLDQELKEYFDSAQAKIMEKNPNACVIETNSKHARIFKCGFIEPEMTRPGKTYFNF